MTSALQPWRIDARVSRRPPSPPRLFSPPRSDPRTPGSRASTTPRCSPGPPQEVLDVAGYLTKGEIARLTTEVRNLEKDTGYKLRVLAQAYPKTPGLAVKDYWNVDDDTVVFVADPGLGNILNFSVGHNVDLDVPPSFWTRLSGKYGTILLAGEPARRRQSPTR